MHLLVLPLRPLRYSSLTTSLALLGAAFVLVALSGCAVGGTPAALGALGPDTGSVTGPGSGWGPGSDTEPESDEPNLGSDPVSGLGTEDGYIPDGESVALTDDVPAVTRLDGRLRDALASAADAATAAGRDVQITLVDGWRSARYQQYLFDQAVLKYGSAEEAARWVKGPGESKHVQGQAVDIATADAMDWLNRFGEEFGLCQVYANEAWHFELTADAAGAYPPPLTDATAG